MFAKLPRFPYFDGMLTPAQIRAARALLNWNQKQLAEASGIATVTIKNIERGASDPRMSSVQAIKLALEKAGVVFLDDRQNRDGGPGVRLAQR